MNVGMITRSDGLTATFLTFFLDVMFEEKIPHCKNWLFKMEIELSKKPTISRPTPSENHVEMITKLVHTRGVHSLSQL